MWGGRTAAKPAQILHSRTKSSDEVNWLSRLKNVDQMTYLKFLNFQDFLLKKLVVFFDERCQSLDADFQLRVDSERNSVLAGWLMAS